MFTENIRRLTSFKRAYTYIGQEKLKAVYFRYVWDHAEVYN